MCRAKLAAEYNTPRKVMTANVLTRKRKVRGSPCTQNGHTFHNGQGRGLWHNGHNLTHHSLHKSRSTLWHHNLKKNNLVNKRLKKKWLKSTKNINTDILKRQHKFEIICHLIWRLTEPRWALQPQGTQWFPRIGLFVVQAISLGPYRWPIEFLTS